MDTLKRLTIVGCLLTGIYITCCVAACPGMTFTYNNTLTICYWLITTEQSAQLSEEKCIDEGGNLAYVPNGAALDTINTLKSDAGYVYTPEFYIGYRETGNTVYVWDTDQEQTYTNWKSGEPSSSTQDCIVIYNIDGTWWDEDCSTSYKAVCSDYSPRTGPTTEAQSTTTTSIMTTTTTTTEPTTTTTQPTTTTTTTTTTPQPTTTMTATTTQPSCIPCSCYTNTTNNKTLEEFREEIRKELLVDTSTLSSSIRKKTSASDPRPSAAAVGYVGVVLLTTVFGGLILMDAGNIVLCGKAVVRFTKKLLHK